MNSYEVEVGLRERLAALRDAAELRKYIVELAALDDEIEAFVPRIVIEKPGSGSFNTTRQALHEVLMRGTAFILAGPPASAFYHELGELKRRLVIASRVPAPTYPMPGAELVRVLMVFTDALDAFVRLKGSLASTLTVLRSAGRARTIFDSTESTASMMLLLLDDGRLQPSEGEAVLDLVLYSTLETPGAVVGKVEALLRVYRGIAGILGVTVESGSPRLRRLESGSTRISLVDLAPILKTVERFLGDFIGFVYRNFTREGKLSTIPQKRALVESMFEAREVAAASGLNTPDADDALAHMYTSLVKSADALVSGEPQITINGTNYGIGETYRERFIEATARPQLSSGARNDSSVKHLTGGSE